jgi:hypothetical protein
VVLADCNAAVPRRSTLALGDMNVVLSHRPPGAVKGGLIVVLMVVGIACEHGLLDVVGIHGRAQAWFLIPTGAVLGITLAYRLRQYADLVEDRGDSLHVVLQGRNFSFPLEQIGSVVLTTLGASRTLVRLHFKKTSSFRAAIRFYGALPAYRPTIQADLESLRGRVEGQQRNPIA